VEYPEGMGLKEQEKGRATWATESALPVKFHLYGAIWEKLMKKGTNSSLVFPL
jgi:hypothetical protein